MNETVEQLAAPQPCCVTRSTTVREVFALFKEHSHSAVLICDDQVLVGIFTERDALRYMARGADLEVPVGDVMTTNPSTVRVGSRIGEALQKMSGGGFRRMPIVDELGRPIAVIDMPVVVHYLDQYFPASVYNLPPKEMDCTAERDGA